jgi:hypothetical protein
MQAQAGGIAIVISGLAFNTLAEMDKRSGILSVTCSNSSLHLCEHCTVHTEKSVAICGHVLLALQHTLGWAIDGAVLFVSAYHLFVAQHNRAIQNTPL